MPKNNMTSGGTASGMKVKITAKPMKGVKPEITRVFPPKAPVINNKGDLGRIAKKNPLDKK